MERRDFLQRVGTALALAMTPTVTGATTLGGPKLDALDGEDRAGVAQQLRDQMVAIKQTSNMPMLRDWIAERGFDPELPAKITGAMWMTSTFRDMPQKLRRSPEIQAWAMSELPEVVEAVFESADLLETLAPEDRASLLALLESEPDLVDQIYSGFDAQARERGVEEERLTQVRMVTGHLAWRIRKQSPDAVIDEYLHRLDRTCRRHGVDRRKWREGLAAEVPAWLSLDILSDPEAAEVEHTADRLAEIDAIDAVSTSGSHLGLTMAHRPRQRGVQIEHVLRGTPAANSGLQPGDRIVGVDGRDFEATELVGWLATRNPGQLVQIDVDRHGERFRTQLTLGVGPADRIAIPRPRAALRGRTFGYMAAGAAVYMIGLYILGAGAGMFVLGLLMIGAAGGYDAGAIGALGTFLTVSGLMVMGLSLLVILLGLVIEAFRRRPQRQRPSP